jgi:hypothetical protein
MVRGHQRRVKSYTALKSPKWPGRKLKFSDSLQTTDRVTLWRSRVKPTAFNCAVNDTVGDIIDRYKGPADAVVLLFRIHQVDAPQPSILAVPRDACLRSQISAALIVNTPLARESVGLARSPRRRRRALAVVLDSQPPLATCNSTDPAHHPTNLRPSFRATPEKSGSCSVSKQEGRGISRCLLGNLSMFR